MNIYLDMFLTFAKVGVMTFGGGYAMLPILEREVCQNKDWASEEELMDYYAIGQCTPGVIAVNTATFIGRKKKGIPGGIVATLGVIFPSLIIIGLIASVLTEFAEIEWVGHAFAGVRVCVCVLILNAAVKLWKKAVIDRFTFLIFSVVFILSVFLDFSPVIYVLTCAIFGIVFKTIIGKKVKRDLADEKEADK